MKEKKQIKQERGTLSLSKYYIFYRKKKQKDKESWYLEVPMISWSTLDNTEAWGVGGEGGDGGSNRGRNINLQRWLKLLTEDSWPICYRLS